MRLPGILSAGVDAIARRPGLYSGLLVAASVYMAVAAFFRLRYAFLALTQLPWQSVDHAYRYAEVQRWFSGLPVYGTLETADYPPATYVLLWPFLGWLSIEAARWAWAAMSGVVLGAIAWLAVRETGARGHPERWFVALLPLPMYATQLTVWLGQLGLLGLFGLFAGLVWLERGRGRWWEDLGAALLLLLGLVKPTLSIPLFWVVCFGFGRLRPIVFVTLGYGLLTLVAADVQQANLFVLLRDWLGQGGMLDLERGTVNLHRWLDMVGLASWNLTASLVVLLGFGAWTYRNRHADRWCLIGVGALVSRLWIHHRYYDDVLLLLPMIALFRLARREGNRREDSALAALLFAGLWGSSLLPYWTFFEVAPHLFQAGVEIGQTVLWLCALGFLTWQAGARSGTRDRSQPERLH